MERFADLSTEPDAFRFIKVGSVTVTFAPNDGEMPTLEGKVSYFTGDAIVTGVEGERWPVSRAAFDAMYEPDGDFTHGRDGRYRKKITAYVLAKQMNKPFTVNLGKGDVLTGKAGDWLTQYQDGQTGVVRDEIFRKTYKKI